MVEAPERWACEACFDTGLQADGETPCPCQDSRLPSLVRDLKRQIAELRAKVDVQRQSKEYAQRCCEAAEAENARLRALPLKDEVERAIVKIEEIRRQLQINVEIAERDHPEGPIIDGKCVKGMLHSQDILAGHIRDRLNELESLLSRLRAGEQEEWRTECATEGCDKPATVRFERGGIGSYYCHDCYLRIQALPASPSVSDGGNRNG